MTSPLRLQTRLPRSEKDTGSERYDRERTRLKRTTKQRSNQKTFRPDNEPRKHFFTSVSSNVERPSGTVSTLRFPPRLLPVDQSSCFRSITRLSLFLLFLLRLLLRTRHYSFESKLNDEYSFVHRNYIVISVVSPLWKKSFSTDKMCFKFLSEGYFFGNLFESIELMFLSNRRAHRVEQS